MPDDPCEEPVPEGLINADDGDDRPGILTLVGYYLPGYKSGGPVRTIANMVNHLGDRFRFRIVTRDRDAGDSSPFPGVEVDSWNRIGKAEVFYASRKSQSFFSLARLIRETPHEVLYLNSLLDPVFTGSPLFARRFGLIPSRPLLLAPRGELSQGALTLKKWKKRPYLALTRLLGLYKGVHWHATGPEELKEIQKAFRSPKTIRVAPNLPSQTEALSLERAHLSDIPEGPLRVVFLSRVTPIKNLDFALNVIRKASQPLELTIYGIIDDQRYWRRCQRIIGEDLPDHVTVRYMGVIDHSQVHETLSHFDLFLLPTRGENYGHAIREALEAGVPVLISNRSPWRGLESRGVGWDLSLSDPGRFTAVMDNLARAGTADRRSQRRRCLEYAREISRDGEALEKNEALFADVAGG